MKTHRKDSKDGKDKIIVLDREPSFCFELDILMLDRFCASNVSTFLIYQFMKECLLVTS